METKTLILPESFYNRDTVNVARELIGKVLIRKIGGQVLSGRIVETEAYIAEHDPACHAYSGKTKRNEVMFGPPGFAYVYFTYGMHYCLNFVTEPDGVAAAVLIRALEPLEGIEIMKSNRNQEDIKNLCSGPAKLTQAMEIDRSINGIKLNGSDIVVRESSFNDFQVGISTRIGINKGVEFPYRFYQKKSPFLSRREK
ncbi:MAG: DNA-3-methyladenine glycosylase [candidate division Zixibacteria bacterium]|nr:DNA-3-methyladenine glycosylase [candidate division Zixibacteria bacterium]